MTRTVDVDERSSQFESSHAMDAPTSTAHTRAKVRTFAFTFGIAFTLLYTVYERLNWPLFTWQPAVGKMYFWSHRPLSGEGPPMYWYGWIALAIPSARNKKVDQTIGGFSAQERAGGGGVGF